MSFDAESDEEFPSAAQRQLALIANTLGVPVSTFSGGESEPADMEGAIELQRLWGDLLGDYQREQLLSFARDLIRS